MIAAGSGIGGKFRQSERVDADNFKNGANGMCGIDGALTFIGRLNLGVGKKSHGIFSKGVVGDFEKEGAVHTARKGDSDSAIVA